MSSVGVLGSLPPGRFLCSLCANIFTDPVTTPCGHSFCKSCLERQWDRSEFCQCPACKKRFCARPEMSTNSIMEEVSVQLKRRRLEIQDVADGSKRVDCDICAETALRAKKSCLVCQASYCSEHLESHLRVPGLMRHALIEPVDNIEERICPIHDKALGFYCRDDGVCICALCHDGEHKHHRVVSMEEEGAKQKENIDALMDRIKIMIDQRKEKIKEVTEASATRKEKAQKQIQSMDAVMNLFTTEIQKAQTKVKTGVQDKLRSCHEREQRLVRELQDDVRKLQQRTSELEELKQSEDPLHLLQTVHRFSSPSELKDCPGTMAFSDVCLETVRLAVSKLLNTFQSILKILTEEEITKMKKYKESLSFDADTAGHRLYVYDYRNTRIKHYKYPTKTVTDNAYRFKLPMVFTTEGFTSGRHYWEVQVGLRSDWDVGVAKETVSRKNENTIKSGNGFYVIKKERLKYCASSVPSKVLQLSPRPSVIGVFLDYEDGRVSFYDDDKKEHIYSFTGQKFTEKLFPYFYLFSNSKKSEPMELCTISEYNDGPFHVFNKKEENDRKEIFSSVKDVQAGPSQPAPNPEKRSDGSTLG